MDITYRAGKIEDCRKLAELNYIASGGVVEFLFHDLIPGRSPVQIVAANFAADHDYHTFRDAVVAECNQKVVGMSLSYPSHFHRLSDEMRKFFPEDRLNHVKSILTSNIDDSLYIDTLCVDPDYQRKGIGSKLISLTLDKARQRGFNALSLIVLADNLEAIKLYRRRGFEIESRLKMDAHELIPHEGGALLMKCII